MYEELLPTLAFRVNERLFVLDREESRLSTEIEDVVEPELLKDALVVEERNVVNEEELTMTAGVSTADVI